MLYSQSKLFQETFLYRLDFSYIDCRIKQLLIHAINIFIYAKLKSNPDETINPNTFYGR